MIRNIWFACFVVFSASLAHAGGRPKFTPLGTLGYTASFAEDVSADGRVIVGGVWSSSTDQYSVFRWTDGAVEFLPINRKNWTSPAAVSADGSTVVGARSNGFGSVTEAFRWTDTAESLGSFPAPSPFSQAFGVSADGSTIVGTSILNGSVTPFKWTQSTGMVAVDDVQGRAFAVSADGSIIAGNTGNGNGPGILWPSGQTFGLSGATYTDPQAISADGSVVVGHSIFGFSAYDEAFRWTAETGTVRLDAGRYSQAWNISPDGSVIVGGHTIGDGAWFWTSETGYRPMQDWLETLGVTGLDGWNLTHATGVSADGQTIVGHGILNGRTQSWALSVPRYKKFVEGMPASTHLTQAVPEPATWALVLIPILGWASAYLFQRWLSSCEPTPPTEITTIGKLDGELTSSWTAPGCEGKLEQFLNDPNAKAGVLTKANP